MATVKPAAVATQAVIRTPAPTPAPTPVPVAAAPCRGVPFDPAQTGIDGYVTWNLQPVAGVEVFALAGENYGAPRAASAVTDSSGYWKLTGFTDIDRPYMLHTPASTTYDATGYTFNEDSSDPSNLCANKIVRLNTGSGLQQRYDSLSKRKYMDGVTLTPSAAGAVALTWDSRGYSLSPTTEVPAGDLTVTWQQLGGALRYCVKLIDSTGGGWVYGKETCLTGSSFTFTGLAAGKTYSVHLLAWGTSRKPHDMIGNELVAFQVK